MAELVLVRHGETDWNVAEVFRGRADVALNATGLKQAELLGEYLSREKILAVYASPLQRARQTAQPIAEHHGLKVNLAPGLEDFDYGAWQGLSHQEVKDKYPELYNLWHGHPERVKIPGGENLSEVRERALPVVTEVTQKFKGTVVLVSHRVVNKVLICALLGLDNSHFWNVRQDTGGITRFGYEEERFILTVHNDTSYLRSLRPALTVDF